MTFDRGTRNGLGMMVRASMASTDVLPVTSIEREEEVSTTVEKELDGADFTEDDWGDGEGGRRCLLVGGRTGRISAGLGCISSYVSMKARNFPGSSHL